MRVEFASPPADAAARGQWRQATKGEVMLTLLVVLKLWAEVALLALLGQGVLALLAGDRVRGNWAYELLRVLSRPAIWLVARMGPAGLSPRRQAAIAGVGLSLLWLLVTVGKVWLCLSLGPGQCR